MFSPVRLSLCSAILLFSSGLYGATAQPLPSTAPPAPPIQLDTLLRVEATTAKDELYLQAELRNVDVVKAIQEIANKGHLQVAVKADVTGTIPLLSFQNATPGVALQKVCEAAGIYYEIKEGIWLISAQKNPGLAENKPKIIDSMVFTNVGVVDLLSLISRQFDVPIAISADVKGTISFLKLENKTPRQALEIIALAAEAKLEEAKDGTFILSKPGKPLELPPVQPPALQPPAAQLPVPDESVPAHPQAPTLPPGFMLL